MTISYYYQTLDHYREGMDALVSAAQGGKLRHQRVVVYLSSFHFGKENESFYIHLNDSTPSDTFITDLAKWQPTIEFRIMLGGAGGAYGTMFETEESYTKCYRLLIALLQNHRDVLKGIDIDVEEPVGLDNIKKLLLDIRKDMGTQFCISMAPVSYSMETDSEGMGGFVYKELYHSVGHLIDLFNIQCYQGSFSYQTFESIVTNGYPANKLVFGMLGDEFLGVNTASFKIALNDYHTFISKYKTTKGAVLWEFGDTRVDPVAWGEQMISCSSSRRKGTSCKVCVSMNPSSLLLLLLLSLLSLFLLK